MIFSRWEGVKKMTVKEVCVTPDEHTHEHKHTPLTHPPTHVCTTPTAVYMRLAWRAGHALPRSVA